MPRMYGTVADRPNPTESVRYLPTIPPELPRPCGWRLDVELSNSRADSHAAADSTTVRQRTCRSSPVALSMDDTAVTFPDASVMSSCAMELASTVTRPA